LYTGATARITTISPDGWKQAIDAYTAGHNSDGELWYTVAKGGETIFTVATGASSVALGIQEFSGLGPSPTEQSQGISAFGTRIQVTSGSGPGVAVGFAAGHANGSAIEPFSSTLTDEPQVTTVAPIASLIYGHLLVASGNTSYGGSIGSTMWWSAGIAIFAPST
ncbi:MAG: hypothetical protein ACRDYE_16405, partial [Acidimicrobiales bacterium]